LRDIAILLFGLMERRITLELNIDNYVEESSYEDYLDEGEIDLEDRTIYENTNYDDSKSSVEVPQVRTFKTGSDSKYKQL
jgi:hypothetical protein